MGEERDFETPEPREGVRLVRNAFFRFGADSFEAFVAVAVISILAHALSLEEFGRYSFVIAYTAISRFLAGLGLPIIVVREIARDRSQAPQVLGSAFLLHILLAVGYLAGITGTVALFTSDHDLIVGTALAAAAINADFFARLFCAVFKGYERMEFEAAAIVLQQATYLVGTLVVVRTHPTLVAIFAVMFAANTAGALLSYVLLAAKFLRPTLSGCCGQWRFMLKEAYPVGLRRILRLVSYRVDTILLVALKGNVEAGLFHGVYKLVNGFGFIAEAVAQTVYPMISRQIDSGEAHFTYELTIKYLVVISLPLVIAFGFFTEPLIGLVLGAKFLSAAWTMRFLGAALVLLFVSNLMERMLIAHNRQRASSLLTAASVVVLVAFDLSLIPRWGAFGAGVATLIGEAVLLVLYHVYIRRCVGGHEVFRSALKPLAAAVLACLAIYLSLAASVLVQAGAGLAAYLGTLLVLGTFTAEEVGIIRESLRRRPRPVRLPERP